MIWETSENQFGRPKKTRQSVENFWKPPHLKKILDPPLNVVQTRFFTQNNHKLLRFFCVRQNF